MQCATLIVRLEPSPVLPGAASQRSRHTPRGHPIYRIGRRLYVHRLSPTSGLGTTALNCPLKLGNSSSRLGLMAATLTLVAAVGRGVNFELFPWAYAAGRLAGAGYVLYRAYKEKDTSRWLHFVAVWLRLEDDQAPPL